MTQDRIDKLIEISGLYYIAGNGIVIFEGVDAGFYSGERVAITGPHGLGKTTLIRLFLGLDKPQKGTICLFGEDIGMLERPELDGLRQGIGVVLEDSGIVSNLKVVENVMLPLQYHTEMTSDNIMERAVFLLDHVGYRGDIWALPGPLPSYTKKTIAFARAISLDPAIMIYDMLLEGLDAVQSSEMLGLVDKFHKEKKDRLSIMTINDERDIKEITLDRILRIENRRILE
ncbi:MAG: ATP-binding cassette domain-containing protein [Nitrospirae bacterium]|nr:ATP-binding cassette domain-containing protein [Nitrospirota bacterium]